MPDIQRHFSSIANQYAELRTTDCGPVRFIHNRLAPPWLWLRGADVGCGTGRYSMMLSEHLGPRLFLYCIDGNREMLRTLRRRLQAERIDNCEPVHGFGRNLPLRDGSLDFVSTFNAVHHFNVSQFLREACRTLKPAGRLFIYTRTRSQNARNIWGRYFPDFTSKETRLFEREELIGLIETIANLKLEAVETFVHRRQDTLGNLIHKARSHHYSTFCLYSERELEQALRGFERRIRRAFKDTQRITWVDENTLFVLRKRVYSAQELPDFGAAQAGLEEPTTRSSPVLVIGPGAD